MFESKRRSNKRSYITSGPKQIFQSDRNSNYKGFELGSFYCICPARLCWVGLFPFLNCALHDFLGECQQTEPTLLASLDDWQLAIPPTKLFPRLFRVCFRIRIRIRVRVNVRNILDRNKRGKKFRIPSATSFTSLLGAYIVALSTKYGVLLVP